MDLGIPEILSDIAGELAQNGTPIVLTWNVWPTGSVPSPVDGSRPGTPTVTTETQPAFVHFVPVAGHSSVRQFAEIEVGDVILDFAPDVDFRGRDNLRFQVQGQWYVPKETGRKLAETWDVAVQGQNLFRTILVRKAT